MIIFFRWIARLSDRQWRVSVRFAMFCVVTPRWLFQADNLCNHERLWFSPYHWLKVTANAICWCQQFLTITLALPLPRVEWNTHTHTHRLFFISLHINTNSALMPCMENRRWNTEHRSFIIQISRNDLTVFLKTKFSHFRRKSITLIWAIVIVMLVFAKHTYLRIAIWLSLHQTRH